MPNLIPPLPRYRSAPAGRRPNVGAERLEGRRLMSAAYRVIDLGTLGGDFSQGNGINADGHVAAGAAAADGTVHAALFRGGRLRDLGTLGGDAYGTAVNAANRVAGYSALPDGDEHAVLFDGKQLRDLGTLGGPNSHAFGINNAGVVVGDADVPDPATGDFTTHAFAYRGGTMRDLGTMGGPFSFAAAVNDKGQIAGFSALPGDVGGVTPNHAFLYANGTFKDLGTLGDDLNSEAFGLNSRGWVVGTSESPTGPSHAFLYRDGRMTDLGTLVGGQSFATAVNDDGLVVGDSLVAEAESHAFLYAGGELRDLNGLIDPASGWTLQSAAAINNAGKITGVGTIDGEQHGFLLVPARVTGTVFADPNRNGRRDPGERGLAGWRVYLDVFGDGVYRPGDPTAVTGPDGRYAFGSLPPGKYVVRIVPQKGYSGTGPAGGAYTVTLKVGELRTYLSFGQRRG